MATSELTAANQEKPSNVIRWPAPAVASAFRILDYLANTNPEAGVSELARALHLNKSTCFNVLLTLLHFQVVIKSDRQALYRLGPRLVELGTATRRLLSERGTIRDSVRPLVDATSLTCFIAQRLADNSGLVIIDRVAPHKLNPFHVPIGQFIPMSRPAMWRAIFARTDELEAVEAIRRLDAVAPDTDDNQVVSELRQARKKGFVASVGDYAQDVNAVVAAIAAPDGEVDMLVCLVDHATALPARRLASVGSRLAALTKEIEARRRS